MSETVGMFQKMTMICLQCIEYKHCNMANNLGGVWLPSDYGEKKRKYYCPKYRREDGE